jgi:short-subunit dehydrogenase
MKAIIIGATSGLGREIAFNLLREGWHVGIAGRREELLKEIADSAEFGTNVVYERIDITSEDAIHSVERLLSKLGDIDLFVNVSGVGFQNPSLDSTIEKNIFDVNGYGFMRMVDWAYNYFMRTNRPGHIAIISAIAGTKPLGTAAAYSATKRMQSHYITALSQLARMEHLNIRFTDIRPGFAATDILNPNKHYPMMMTKEYAGRLATRAILKKKRVAIIDWKFAILTFFWSLIPRCIWERLTFVKN